MTIANCDFCGKKAEVKRTHYGTSFGYVRLICDECQKELNAEIIKGGIDYEKNQSECNCKN